MAGGFVVADGGLVDRQQVLRLGFIGRYWLRLFQNDHDPDRADTVGSYVEATFSGYPGPVPITDWTSPAVSAHVSSMKADLVNYTHSGGPLGNYIFGYYVTNAAGALMWAERRPGAGLPMFQAGEVYQVTPVQSDTSDLP